MNIFRGAMGKSLTTIKENATGTKTNSAEKLQDNSTGNKGEKDDNIEPMEMENGKEKEKDEEKEAEITATVESWKDTFAHEKSNYHAVKLSKRFPKLKIPAWSLNKEEQGKDMKDFYYPMMQMIGAFVFLRQETGWRWKDRHVKGT